ncbi:MAG: tetratricopeptide repeat protein [Saprospiraceae bacterium]|nr:tetratricopeptide repeat protein [Saprospiraceae bacterium]
MGPEHPQFANSLYTLSTLYLAMGEFEKCEASLLKTQMIRRKVLGNEHPDYVQTLRMIAELYTKTNKTEKAEAVYAEISILDSKLLGKAVYHLSERELANYMNIFSKSVNDQFCFNQIAPSEHINAVSFDNIIFQKGFLMQAAAHLRKLSDSDGTYSESISELRAMHRSLGDLYLQPLAERDSNQIAQIESQIELREKELARSMKDYGNVTKQIKWQHVQQKLKPNEAALEFIQYEFNQANENSDSSFYAALILLPGNSFPKFVPLLMKQ